jgi:plasmid stabilization system protein ParE
MGEKSLNIIWTPKAVDALDTIHGFYASKSVNAADRMSNGIIETASSLVFPEQYQLDETDPQGRRMIYRYYKIFYEVHHGAVFILNIIDTRMNPSKGIGEIDN